MRYTNIARRALALVCTAALAAIPALGLSACGGPSDEELIKQTLTADLDAIKTVDEDTVKSMMGDSAVSEMETYGIDAFAFYTNCVKQFSYDNVDVTVDGDSATATLDVTNVDIEKVMTSWANDVSAYVTSQEAIDDYNNLGENGMMQKMLQQLTDALGTSDAPTKTSSMSIDFTKGDDGWDLSDASQLSNLVFVGADLSGLGNL